MQPFREATTIPSHQVSFGLRWPLVHEQQQRQREHLHRRPQEEDRAVCLRRPVGSAHPRRRPVGRPVGRPASASEGGQDGAAGDGREDLRDRERRALSL